MRCTRRRRGVVITGMILPVVLVNVMLFELNGTHVGKIAVPAGATTSYAVSEVYPQAGHTFARLREIHWWDNFDHYSRVQRNFIAEFTLDPPAAGAKEERVRLGAINETAMDNIHDTSHFFPVPGKGACVQTQNTWLSSDKLFFCDGARQGIGTLATVAAHPGNPDFGALAVTRTGSMALVASADEVRIGNPADWSSSTREDGPIAEIRKSLATSRGNAGDWHLTADARFVVAVPKSGVQKYSHGVYSESGGTSDAAQTTVAGIQVNWEKEALIYDRQTKKASTCLRELNRAELIDAESVDGRLQLLYAKDNPIATSAEIKELHRVDTITAADVSGHTLYEHQVISLNTYILYAGWDPARRQIWFRVRDVHCHLIEDDLPTEKPEADHHLMVWDSATNTERQGRLPVTEIKATIDKLPPPSGGGKGDPHLPNQ